MIFNEISFYVLFLLPCALLFYQVSKVWRSWVLMTFGVGFFCYYSFSHFGEFWGIATVLIFVVETLVSRLYKHGSKWCLYGIVQAVVILGIFKYLYFFSQVWNDSMLLIGSENFIGIKKLILPLGISFFTFEFVHFAYDVYTGKIKEAELKEYGAFIFFFPCMVAGPIKRFNDFVVGIRRDEWDYSLVTQGITRICLGLMKKHVFADTLSLFSEKLLTDSLYEDSGLAIYGYIMAYAFKVYIDFSAYSDIAIGCGNVFNFKIPENFNWPYISKNIAEFWRRWQSLQL